MFYYSTSILEKAGVKESRVASCAVGVVSVIMTGVTVSIDSLIPSIGSLHDTVT